MSGTVKAANFKFVRYIHGPSEENSMKNLAEKGVWAYLGTAQLFSITSYYLRNS